MRHGAIHVNRLIFPDGSSQKRGLSDGASFIKNVSTNYTLVEEDLSRSTVRVNAPSGSVLNVTFPTEQTVPCAIGSKVVVSSAGDGYVSLVGAPGVTIHSPRSNILGMRAARAVAIKTLSNTWELAGSLLSTSAPQSPPIVVGNPYSGNVTFDSNIRFVYFEFTSIVPGILSMSSTGPIGTVGTLYDSTGTEVDINFGTDTDGFELFSSIVSGTYHLKVEPFDLGNVNGFGYGTVSVEMSFIPL